MKKALLIVASLMCLVTTAHAAPVSKYTQITKGTYQVRIPAPTCPPRAACSPISILDVSVPLNGCVDDAVISYKMSRTAKGKIKVILSAVNVNNPQSASVKCLVAATKTVSIVLGTGFLSKEDVQIEFVDYLAQAK